MTINEMDRRIRRLKMCTACCLLLSAGLLLFGCGGDPAVVDVEPEPTHDATAPMPPVVDVSQPPALEVPPVVVVCDWGDGGLVVDVDAGVVEVDGGGTPSKPGNGPKCDKLPKHSAAYRKYCGG